MIASRTSQEYLQSTWSGRASKAVLNFAVVLSRDCISSSSFDSRRRLNPGFPSASSLLILGFGIKSDSRAKGLPFAYCHPTAVWCHH